MNPIEQAKAWQDFFFKSVAGQEFMAWMASMEQEHMDNARELRDTHELASSDSYKEAREHIDNVIAQVASQPQE